MVGGSIELTTTTDDLCVDMRHPPNKENVTTAEDWRLALDKVAPAVVVLRITATRAFDTMLPAASNATGFVVDKRLGIILTNRHVVQPGPIVAEAIFMNREEIPVYPICRDPVHDFGFFRYDPSAVQFLNYEEIALAPEVACVGLEIRVVGNDSGEKVSILSGTLARLDRDAPCYKKDGYNDFNTFYIQAASGTKGGSSGSPVIDWQGRAVALNAGCNSLSASAFYLPLERVVRALRFLQKGRDIYADKWEAVSIPRGTLQATFLHKGFDETRRLGLQNETELMVRHASPPEETGLLVVDSVVPGGPAHLQLEPGDVLVRVNGEVVTQFLQLETLLDDSVENTIELQIERGGASRTVNLVVQDLHSITPDYFLEVSDAVIHPLSYQQARNFHFPCGLVYVAKPGHMLQSAGVPRHAIIKKFAGEEIEKLEEFISVLSKLSRGARVPLEYVTYWDHHCRKCALVTIDHQEWYAPPQIYTRDDSSGLWTAKPAIIQPESLLPSTVLSYGEPVLMENRHQGDLQELTDAVTSIQITDEYGSKESHSRDESDGERLCVEEYISADGVITPECASNESGDAEDPSTMESTASKDHQRAVLSWIPSFKPKSCLLSWIPSFRPKSCLLSWIPSAAVTTKASTAERVIKPTLVMLEVHVPSSCMIDGVHSQHNSGTGVIIHHSQNLGLVAVDKYTVEISASNVMLSFAAFPIEIPGEVVFLHPVHNFALVAYDPSALGVAGASVVCAAKLLPEPALCHGDSVHLIGLSRSLQATSRISTVTNPSAALSISSAACPRYRAMNVEVIELISCFSSSFSGVLTDKHGRVQALWGCFSTQLTSGSSSLRGHQYVGGIPVNYISQVLDKIISGGSGPSRFINGVKRPMPLVRILEVELYPTLLPKAQSFGLSDAWIKALVEKDPVRRQVLRVKGCLAGSNAQNLLEQGDMVLAVNKQPVTCFHDMENACQAVDKRGDNDGKLDITIFRQGQEIDVRVGTDIRDGNGTTRVINWCGCIVQYPHPAVRALGFLPEEGHGVYVSRWCHGSPAHRYGLYSLQWIVEVNGKRTPDLNVFVEVTKEIKHGEFVRVKTVQLNGKLQVLTLKQDLHYWPTWEVVFDPDTAIWRRQIINAFNGNSV